MSDKQFVGPIKKSRQVRVTQVSAGEGTEQRIERIDETEDLSVTQRAAGPQEKVPQVQLAHQKPLQFGKILMYIGLIFLVVATVVIVAAYFLPLPSFIVAVAAILLVLFVGIPVAARYDQRLKGMEVISVWLKALDVLVELFQAMGSGLRR